MTAETLQAAVLNAPIEVQDRILNQLADRYLQRHPGRKSIPLDDGLTSPRKHLYRTEEPPITPPMSEEHKAEMLRRMERLDDSYTVDELMDFLDQRHPARDK